MQNYYIVRLLYTFLRLALILVLLNCLYELAILIEHLEKRMNIYRLSRACRTVRPSHFFCHTSYPKLYLVFSFFKTTFLFTATSLPFVFGQDLGVACRVVRRSRTFLVLAVLSVKRRRLKGTSLSCRNVLKS